MTETLPHLETFAEAAEAGSFTAAARALGLTQAAVSQRIGALEKALGTSLFQRSAGRVFLTDAGKQLHPFARRILALHGEARQKVAGRKAPLAGELSVAASSIPGEHLQPGLLAAFRKKYPHIQVKATVTDSEAVLDGVERGQTQLGLVGKKSSNPNLDQRCFAADTLVLVTPSRHPLTRRRRISTGVLSKQPLIVREAGSGSRWCLEQGLAQTGKSLKDLNIVLELGSNEAIKNAVLRGMGAAILSSLAVKKEIRAGKLHSVAITGLPLTREMFVVWDRRRALPIPAQLFLDLLKARPEDRPVTE